MISEQPGGNIRKAWRLFEQGDFDGALNAFLSFENQLPRDGPEFRAMIEIMIDRDECLAAAEVIDRKLTDHGGDEIEVRAPRIAWEWELFALLEKSGHRERAFEAGLRALEDVAATGSTLQWQHTIGEGWIDRLESSAQTPRELLNVLEQEAFAPTLTGLPAKVIQRIEEMGHSHAEDSVLARESEILLHAVGATAAAYRVERARREIGERELRKSPPRVKLDRPIVGLSIAIAGGHPALRALITRFLMKEGARSVAEIPSAKEASRVGRDVQAALAGSDIAVILVRQIAHSTSDQVRRAAAKLGIPVVLAESSGSAGVRRALERWLTA